MLGAKHMPKSTKGQRRHADGIATAVHVMKIAIGEIIEERTEDGKDAAAVALGRKGGIARARKMSRAARHRTAIKAAKARWGAK